MELIHDLAHAALRHESVLTIGTFDGVHRGHAALIGRVVERARAGGCLAALITFYPHPAALRAPDRAPLLLTTPGEKLALLEGLGVDLVALLPFNEELARTSAADFMGAVRTHLRARELWVGADFRLGRNREGDVAVLRELGARLGYALRVFDPVAMPGGAGEVISSSRIRALLAEGDVEQAGRLLGRFPSLSGEVVHGARRGRRLGFPTANLEVRPGRAVPADGVYAAYAVLGAERYPAVANVGVRPSFDNGGRTVETHLLDFEGDLYGCDLVVEFVARLRPERRFEQIAGLVAQIGRDSAEARRILAQPRPDLGAAAPLERLNGCAVRIEEVEHTADLALRVWSDRLAGLFAGAARGMVRLLADPDGLAASDWREVRIEALDREGLLVRWLNELLYLTESERLLFVEVQITALSDTALVARVGGAPGEPTRAHIKAATFHDLELRQDASGWSTLITFDA